MGVDPATFGKLGEQCAIEATRGAIIDILDAGLLAQLGVAQARGEALASTQRGFAIEQQCQPFGMTDAIGFARGSDINEGFGHAMQAKRVDLIECRMGQHVCSVVVVAWPADIGVDDLSSR